MGEKIFAVNIGDWSLDGHNQSTTFHAVVPDTFSFDEMREAYDKTVREFGFDPANDWFVGYEESSLPMEIKYALKDLGVSRDKFDIDTNYNELTISEETYAEVLMRFIARNLDGFTWRFIEDDGILFGGYDRNLLQGRVSDKSMAQIRSSAGYGLFVN